MIMISKVVFSSTLNKLSLFAIILLISNSLFSQVGYNSDELYGLRKLVPSYSGNAIQVRRTCDNATKNFGFTSCGDIDTSALKKFVVASNPLSSITSGAATAYSLRKLRCTYSGNAITIRRSCDNVTKDIGFTTDGDLDTTTLKAFVLSTNPLSAISASAAGAFSLRKLRCAYAGNAIEVRRSSDNTTQNIGFTTAGDLDTVALKTFVGASNGFIRTWYDQSGNGRDAVQTTNGNQPQLVNTGTINRQNGMPAVYFSGVSIYLTSTLTGVTVTTSGNITTANMVFQSNNSVAGTILSNGDPGANRYNIHTPWNDNNTYLDIGNNGGGGRISTALTWSNLSIGSFQRNGVQGNIWKNGSNALSSNSMASSVTSTLALSIGGSAAYSSYMIGYISELIVFPSALSTIERQYLEWGQSQYYSISGPSLAAGFPTSAPSAYVTRWYDQSGNGRDASQATTANQPRILNAGVIEKQNGVPSIYFSGLTNGLFTANFSGYATAACFNGVAKVNTNVTYNTIINKTNNNNFPCPIDFYNGSILVGNGVSGQYNIYAASQTFNNTQPLGIWTHQANGTAASGVNAYYNSSQIVTNQTASYYGDAAGAALYIGSRYDGVTGLNGWISEVITFGTIPSNTDRQFLEWTQGQYYNISGITLGTLPSGAANAYVTTWYDQSGNGRNLTQTTTSRQPQIINAGNIIKLGKRPSIQGTNALQTNLTVTLSTSYTGTQLSFNSVLQSDINSTANLRVVSVGNAALTSADYNSTNYFNINQRSTNQFVVERNSVINPTTTFTVGSPMVLSTRFNGTNRQLFNNGTGSATTADATSFNFNSLRILQSINPSFEAGEALTGKISEFGIYYSSLSSTRRTLLETNQAAYYNITTSNNKYTPPTSTSYVYYVNGVGRESSTDSVAGTRSTFGLGISVSNTASGFLKDNGDYITTGMNCPISSGATSSNLSGGVTQRWINDWYINKTDVGSNNGLLSLFFDFSDYGVNLTPGVASNYMLLYRTSSAGTFSTVASTTVSVSGDRVLFLVDASNISSNNYYTIGTINTTASPLPIELVDFKCNLIDNKNIELKWITASESNSQYFSVERSANGIDYEAVGYLNAAGNSLNTIHYSYTDKNALNDISYYRLKSVDFDGSYKYSDICSVVNQTGELSISVYPNPANNSVTIDFKNVDNVRSTDFSIMDVTGKQMIVSATQLNNKYTLDLSTLQSGLYFIELNISNKKVLQKIIVQK